MAPGTCPPAATGLAVKSIAVLFKPNQLVAIDAGQPEENFDSFLRSFNDTMALSDPELSAQQKKNLFVSLLKYTARDNADIVLSDNTDMLMAECGFGGGKYTTITIPAQTLSRFPNERCLFLTVTNAATVHLTQLFQRLKSQDAVRIITETETGWTLLTPASPICQSAFAEPSMESIIAHAARPLINSSIPYSIPHHRSHGFFPPYLSKPECWLTRLSHLLLFSPYSHSSVIPVLNESSEPTSCLKCKSQSHMTFQGGLMSLFLPSIRRGFDSSQTQIFFAHF